MRSAWLLYTEQGRTHRRNVWLMFLFGSAGLIAGVVLLVRDGFQFPQIMLTLASCAMLGFLYLVRMRSPQEVLSGVRVHWSISPDRAVIECGTKREEFEWSSIRRMIRTPDGFLFWPNDAFERWLPQSALARSGAVEDFLRIVESSVKRYENVPNKSLQHL